MAMYGEDYDEAYNKARKIQETNLSSKIASPVFDVLAYSRFPQVSAFKGAGLGAKALNMGLTGAYQGGIAGGLESLKQNGDFSGVGTGAGIGGALPVIGKTAIETFKLLPKTGGLLAKTVGRIHPKTLKIRPNKKGSELSPRLAF